MTAPRLVALALLAAAAQAQPAPPAWAADAVWYQLAPERVADGGLQGVLDHVPDLDSLGVTVVSLPPALWGAASSHHVDPSVGPDPAGDAALLADETADPATWVWTSADRLLLDLAGELHRRGIRAVLGGAFGHGGTRSWDVPDGSGLDPAAYLLDVTRRWMDPDGDGDPSDGVDGWRLAAATGVPDGFWRDWTALVGQVAPDALTVAEADADAPAYLARAGFGSAIDEHALAVSLDAFAYDDRTDAAAFAADVADRFRAVPEATLLTAPARLGDTLASPARAPRRAERDLQRAVVALRMALPGAPVVVSGEEADLVAFYRRAIALRRSDAVLRRGTLSVLAAEGRVVAFERVLGGDRRVVVFNAGDASAFVALPGAGVPAPLTPVLVSRDDAGRVPALVASLGDDDVAYGLRVPARTTVVYRPASASDVRPKGLDE